MRQTKRHIFNARFTHRFAPLEFFVILAANCDRQNATFYARDLRRAAQRFWGKKLFLVKLFLKKLVKIKKYINFQYRQNATDEKQFFTQKICVTLTRYFCFSFELF